ATSFTPRAGANRPSTRFATPAWRSSATPSTCRLHRPPFSPRSPASPPKPPKLGDQRRGLVVHRLVADARGAPWERGRSTTCLGIRTNTSTRSSRRCSRQGGGFASPQGGHTHGEWPTVPAARK